MTSQPSLPIVNCSKLTDTSPLSPLSTLTTYSFFSTPRPPSSTTVSYHFSIKMRFSAVFALAVASVASAAPLSNNRLNTTNPDSGLQKRGYSGQATWYTRKFSFFEISVSELTALSPLCFPLFSLYLISSSSENGSKSAIVPFPVSPSSPELTFLFFSC